MHIWGLGFQTFLSSHQEEKKLEREEIPPPPPPPFTYPSSSLTMSILTGDIFSPAFSTSYEALYIAMRFIQSPPLIFMVLLETCPDLTSGFLIPNCSIHHSALQLSSAALARDFHLFG